MTKLGTLLEPVRPTMLRTSVALFGDREDQTGGAHGWCESPSVWLPEPSAESHSRTIFVQALPGTRLRLLHAIPVTLESSPGQVTAWSWDLEEYGVGPDEEAALDHFKRSIVHLYFTLKENAEQLGPLPAQHWAYLRDIIRER
jgi:hypothetical protein